MPFTISVHCRIPLFLIGMMFGSQALINAAHVKTPQAQQRWNLTADAVTVFLAAYTVMQGLAHIWWGASAGWATRVVGELSLPLVYGFWLFALSQATKSREQAVAVAALRAFWRPLR